MAISSADICSSAISPPVYALISQPMSAADSWPASRLARISSTASGMTVPARQIAGAERGRQQIAQAHRPALGVQEQIRAARLQQELPAAPARHQRRTVGSDHADGLELAEALGALGADQAAFRAQGQAERGVLDIAPKDDPARVVLAGSADLKARVVGVRATGYRRRLCPEVDPVDVHLIRLISYWPTR